MEIATSHRKTGTPRNDKWSGLLSKEAQTSRLSLRGASVLPEDCRWVNSQQTDIAGATQTMP
jgi:hypothetical protein